MTREETSATCSSVGLWRRRAAAGLAETEGGVASCVATDSSRRSSHCICGVIEPGGVVAPRAASSSTTSGVFGVGAAESDSGCRAAAGDGAGARASGCRAGADDGAGASGALHQP